MKLGAQGHATFCRGSLPSRERELKLYARAIGTTKEESLPSRERELKHTSPGENADLPPSLPSRERELKREMASGLAEVVVAPLAGARIETQPRCDGRVCGIGRSPRGSAN